MRRIIGISLAGLGASHRGCLGAGQLRRRARDQVSAQRVSQDAVPGSGVTYFSAPLVREVSGATLLTTSTVKLNASAGNSSTAVWNSFNYLYDTTNKQVFEYTTRRFAFDRRTAQLVNCCAAQVAIGNSSIRQSGLVGFLWPFGTQQQTYQVFDPVLNKPRPTRFAGTSTIDGISVNRYVDKVTSTPALRLRRCPRLLVALFCTAEVTLPLCCTPNRTSKG